MSTIDPALLSALLQDPDTVSANVQENYLLVASACLYYYDYLSMLPEEVRLVWRSSRNLSTYFYLTIRYGFLLQITLTLLCNIQLQSDMGTSITAGGCARLQGFVIILNIINFAVISAFVATRLFAMYGRNWCLGVCMFTLGTLSPSSITQATVFAFRIVAAPWPFARCLSIASDSSPLTELVLRYGPIAFSVTNVVYETLCLVLTVAKTFGAYRERRRLRISTTLSLSSLFLRDGTLYFAVLLLLAILNIVAALNTSDLPGFWSTDTDIARVMVPILTSRFIMHLKGMSQDNVRVVLSDFNSVQFANTPPAHFLDSGVESVRLGTLSAARSEECTGDRTGALSMVEQRAGRESTYSRNIGATSLQCSEEQC